MIGIGRSLGVSFLVEEGKCTAENDFGVIRGESLYETLRASGNSFFGYVLLGSTIRFDVHAYRRHDITNQNAMQNSMLLSNKK